MFQPIYSPLEYYLNDAKPRHAQAVREAIAQHLRDHPVDRAQNAATVKSYEEKQAKANATQKTIKKYKRLRGWGIFGIIAVFLILTFVFFSLPIMSAFQTALCALSLILSIVGIVLLCKKINKKIRNTQNVLTTQIGEANAVLAVAEGQMKGFNDSFSDETALRLAEQTLPFLAFDTYFQNTRLAELKTYQYPGFLGNSESTLGTLSGEMYARPFLYERRLTHVMGVKTYSGSLQISWQVRERDSNGNYRTVTKSETLTATLQKPFPEYSANTALYYGHEALDDLTFSRKYAHVEKKSERALEKTVRRGEKKLEDLEEKALKTGDDFTQLLNTEFEVLFNATNRNEDLLFRQMFTVKAQDSMVKLLLSKEGYGDDFIFEKRGKLNVIKSEHSQSGSLGVPAMRYRSHSLQKAEENFIALNEEFLKKVYFDFAPLLLIPVYQQPLIKNQVYSGGELTAYNHEEIANILAQSLEPQDAATHSIFKTTLTERTEDSETFSVVAYAYSAHERRTYVTRMGGDGHSHNVPVDWVEYIPTERRSNVRIVRKAAASGAPQNAVPYYEYLAYVL